MSSRQQRKANRLKLQATTVGQAIASCRLSNPLKGPASTLNRSSSSENPAKTSPNSNPNGTTTTPPANPEERLQVDTIIRAECILRRFFCVEAQLREYHPGMGDQEFAQLERFPGQKLAQPARGTTIAL